MDQFEIKQYLQENLTIWINREFRMEGNRIVVKLKLEEDTISEDYVEDEE